MSIDVRGVSHAYAGQQVLSDVSFAVAAGSITGLLGPNGSGKSTLIRRAVGLLSGPGEVTFDGAVYARLSAPTSTVGTVLDTGGMWPGMRVEAHLAAVAAATGLDRSLVPQLLAQVGLEAAARKRVKALSLGMRQRLALATALIPSPTHLVLDEPTNGLDPHAVRWLGSLLRTFADDGGCVLVSSHLIGEIEAVADEIVIISGGSVLMQGRPQDLASQGTRATTLVRCDDPLRLAKHFTSVGAKVSFDIDERLRIDGMSARLVREEASMAGVALTEVIAVPASLESAYLEAVQP